MTDLPNLANLDYVGRVNRGIEHIQRNLGQPLKLEDVAKAFELSQGGHVRGKIAIEVSR